VGGGGDADTFIEGGVSDSAGGSICDAAVPLGSMATCLASKALGIKNARTKIRATEKARPQIIFLLFRADVGALMSTSAMATSMRWARSPDLSPIVWRRTALA
jgi:hypothetical protein